MSAPAPGYYEISLATVTLLVSLPLFALFISNRRIYPLAQREPVLAVASNLANTVMICMWLYENEIPAIPLIERKITTHVCMGIIFPGFLVRAWKLFIDAGLASERVNNKHGWFIRHRHYRSGRFLAKLILVLLFFHFCIAGVTVASGSEYNLLPARAVAKNGIGSVLAISVVCLYWFSFVVFSVLLARTKDGFFIKFELRLVGLGCGACSLAWMLTIGLALPCSLGSCSVFIMWLSWLWMMSCSIVVPLVVAIRQAGFSWTRCFKTDLRNAISLRSRWGAGRAFRVNSVDGARQFNVSVEVSDVSARRLSEHCITSLRRVSLATFLTHPPGREAFRKFTVREFSVENLLFVEAVEHFEKTADDKEFCKRVYDEYIPDSAPNQVNLPCLVTQRLHARMQEAEFGGPGFFDEAVEHVMKLMQRDAFKRFQNTPEWLNHVVVFDNVSSDTTVSTSELTGHSRSCSPASMIHTRSESPTPPSPSSAPLYTRTDSPYPPSPAHLLLTRTQSDNANLPTVQSDK